MTEVLVAVVELPVTMPPGAVWFEGATPIGHVTREILQGIGRPVHSAGEKEDKGSVGMQGMLPNEVVVVVDCAALAVMGDDADGAVVVALTGGTLTGTPTEEHIEVTALDTED